MTVTVRVPLSEPADGKRLLRRAALVKGTALPADRQSHYQIRFGVMSGDRFSTLGAYDGGVNKIEPGRSFSLTGQAPFDRALGAGEVLALEIARIGNPVPLFDAAVVWTTAFRSALAGPDFEDRLAQFFSRSGALEREQQRGLGGVFVEAFTDPQRSYTTTDKTITKDLGFVSTDVSITFKMPSWATRGSVHVTGKATPAGSGGTAGGTISIYDGVTDHDALVFTATAADRHVESCGYSGEIIASTTYTLRLAATLFDLSLAESLIYGTCSWR